MMKRLASIFTALALAFGLMVPAMAFADDGYASVSIDYDGQHIVLEPQIEQGAHSLMITFEVKADVAKYQPYVQVTGFDLSDQARSARIADRTISGSTVTAVISNGEDALFEGDNFFLGTLSVNVAAKLVPDESTGAKIVVSTMDTTDDRFATPVMYTMDTHDDTGALMGVEARSVSFVLPQSAYTGSEYPVEGGGNQEQPTQPVYEKDPSQVVVSTDLLGTGASISVGARSTLQSIGSETLQKIKDDLANMLAGNGSLIGLTPEQLKSIAEVIQEAGGDLSQVDISLTPVATKLGSDDAKEDIAILDKKFAGATLLSAYDLGVIFQASCGSKSTGEIPMSELTSPIEFTLGVPEGAFNTMNAAVGFMHDGQPNTIDKGVVPSATTSTVQFPAQKFSTYGVYGKMKSATPRGSAAGLAATGDATPLIMLVFVAVILVVSFLVIFTGRRYMFSNDHKGKSSK